MSFWSHLRQRLLQAIPTIFGLSVLIFALTRVVPGDPVRLALGPTASEEQVIALRQELGLDEPLHVQYVDWLIGVFQGDWGRSLRTDQNVYQDLVARFPATLELVLIALFIAVALAVPFGVIAGTNKDQWPDYTSRIAALVGVSMPRFWLGILFQVVFVVGLGLFPLVGRLPDAMAPPPAVTGLYTIDTLLAGQFNKFLVVLKHLTLPGIAIGLGTLAQIMRLIRSQTIEESREDYVMNARAFGLPQNLIAYKYMLKNSFTSSLTILGLAFGLLLGNAFTVEIVFAWPGMARYGVNSILFQDFNGIMGVVMIVGIAYLTANFVVDLLYGYLDPRIRLGDGSNE